MDTRKFTVTIIATLILYDSRAFAQRGDSPHGYAIQNEYTNPVYGYRVSIPNHLVAYGDAQPRPNHGVEISLGLGRTIYINAEFDSLFLGSGENDIRNRMGYDRGSSLKLWKTKLGVDTAAEGTFLTEKNVVKIVDMYAVRDGSPILYSMKLETNARNEKEDTAIFEKIQASFCEIKRQ